MGVPSTKKRSRPDFASGSKKQRPNKKQRQVLQYNSDSEEDLDTAFVDDVAARSGSGSDSEEERRPFNPATRKRMQQPEPKKKSETVSEDESGEGEGAGAESDDDIDIDDEVAEFSDSDDETSQAGSRRQKSKRNDPGAFATSLQKILSTKLSNSKKADAILSRSVDAQKASKQIVDATLEAKARKHLREQKLLALEKGRVKDVLTEDTVDGASTGEIMQLERRLRKTAHRGVIMLFRAVREAQERAVEAEKEVRKEGVIGSHQRKEKVNEMSRQGFLDLIAHGGGKPKRSAIEEA
ncbi:Rrp15p-domain-containing protein [Xylariaceae sp. FL0594]|nr:Rrp15p-domain-containing protein [Xylariaceae sp. FL0594]